ncbi:MAG TPA: response regulator [Sphingomicrobium sp.]|jgi:DNA-binding NarL/FixJ family response regulator|nr:response regulator [Sphingomicrobium sp.]
MPAVPKALIVEDEALIATSLESILESAGCEVVGWATDCDEARALAAAHNPNFAIVDIQLRGGEDGIALAAELHEERGITIVFVTAQTDPVTVERAKSVPHHAYVSKPYTAERILTALPGGGC